VDAVALAVVAIPLKALMLCLEFPMLGLNRGVLSL
jgi:hypothetical protein